jgi:hypothetical protein
VKHLQGQNRKYLSLAAVAVLMGAGIWLSRGLGTVHVWLYGLGMCGLTGIAAEGFLGRPAEAESRWNLDGLTPWLAALMLVASGLWLAQMVPADWLVQEALAAALVAVALLVSLKEAAAVEGRYSRYGRFAVNLIFFLLAFVLFALIYQTKLRAAVIATSAGLVALVAALELLRSGAERRLDGKAVALAGVAAVVLAESTWLLGYWPVGGLVGGALLLLGFYVLVGLLQCIRDGSLDRGAVLEYGAVGSIGFLAILIAIP